MIYAKVNGQQLETFSDPIYSDSINFLSVKFDLSAHWKNCKVTALFKNENGKAVAVILDEDTGFFIGDSTYIVPYEVIYAPGFSLSLVGNGEDMRITTNAVQISVEQSGYGEGIVPSDPTLTEYEQLLMICSNAKEIAQSIRDDADNGVFKGDKGDKGDKGEKGDAFTYSDFTEEQLYGLTGPQGRQGPKGEKGDKGDSYYLTESDKTEIAEIALTLLPDGDEVSY